MRVQIMDLEKRNESLTKDLARAEDSLAAEKKGKETLQASLTEEKSKNTKLEASLDRLNQDLKEYQMQVAVHKQRMQSKSVDEDNLQGVLRDKNAEINQYINEIQALSEENAHLASEVELMEQELEATVAEIDRHSREKEEAHALIINSDKLIDKLTEERDALQSKVTELSDRLENKDYRDESLVGELQGEVSRHQQKFRESLANLKEKESEIARLHLVNQELRDELDSLNIDQMKKDISDRDDIILNLRVKLDEAKHDFELLSLDWDQIYGLLDTTKDDPGVDAIRSQMENAMKQKEKLEVYRDRHKEDRAKIRQVDEQLEEKERELVDLRKRMEQYEKGTYGLKEAVREIKELKLQISIRDKEITTLTKSVNDFEAQVNDFNEENMELRRRLGIDERTKIDLSNLRIQKHIELEQAKALNITLKREIDKLEEERLSLKARLRLHALERGERAVELGLSAEDLLAVEDYVAKLREGHDHQETVSRAVRPVLNNDQLEKLTIELERVHVEVEECRKKIELLEVKKQEAASENQALKAAVKEISHTLLAIRKDADGQTTLRADESSFPIVGKLVRLLESKENRDKMRGLEGAPAAEDFLKINELLREELRQTKEALVKKSAEKEVMEEKLDVLEQSCQTMKEKLGTAAESLAEAVATAGTKTKKQQHLLNLLENLPKDLTSGTILDYGAVTEYLLECMFDLHEKDEELEESQKALEWYHDKFATLANDQASLYKQYTTKLEQHEKTIADLEQQLQDAIAEGKSAETKADEFERTLQTLMRGDHDEIQTALVEAQRSLVVLKVNEEKLVRRYMAASDTEAMLRKENERIKAELVSLDEAARSNIGRLVRYKKNAQKKIDHLLKMAHESVPAKQHSEVENKLLYYIAKTRILLEREQEWISRREEQDAIASEARELQCKVDQLQIELLEAKKTAVQMESALKDVSESPKSSDNLQQLSRAHQKIATLEVQLEVFKKRTELAEHKVAALEVVEKEIKKQFDGLDKRYIEVMDENIRLREVEMELRNKYQGGATSEDNEQNLKLIQKLEADKSALHDEMSKYKQLADISTTQAADLAYLQTTSEKEKQMLRATIEELQMEGDEKLLIGKLHHHILVLQVSEATALRKLEGANEKCLKLEGRVVQLEKAVDDRDNTIYQMKLDNKTKATFLRKNIASLRAKIEGMVLPDRYERSCDLVRILDMRKARCEKEITEFKEKCVELEDKLAESTESLKLQQELLSTLQQTTTSSSTAASTAASINERITAWHKRLSDMQLRDLRLQRELANLKEMYRSVKGQLESGTAHLVGVENELVRVQ
ncbi:hypothetical protein HK102_000920, partial [Quaeritorhiza haematococci]